jgi:hypothetical protein
MQAVVRLVLLVGGVAACHTSDPGDGGDGSTDPDGAGGGVGLTVPFFTLPTTIPGQIKTDVTVSRILFRMASLRVIGDAGPGDTRTSQNTFQLTWSEGMKPASLVFVDAPSGVYSKVALLADGNLIDYSYEIYGTVKLPDGTHQYKIHDRSPLGAAIDADVMLEPGKRATLNIRVELAPAFDGLDFTMLHDDSGTLELDTFDSQMGDFRSRLASHSFTAPHDVQE